MPSLADLLRNDPWGAPPSTPLAKTVNDVGFDPSLGFAGAVQTYLSRLKQMQGGLAQDMLDTAADPNAEGIQRAATQRLKDVGIKGIKYKDAGSRNGSGGTYNYVIFDDSLISILKKYGIPMTAGAGGAAIVSGKDMPQEFSQQIGG